MDSFLINFIGFCAGTCTTFSFLPQVVKAYQSGSTKDLSFIMLLVFSIGVLLWIYYGVLTNAFPVILTNSVTIILTGQLLGMKIKENIFDKKL